METVELVIRLPKFDYEQIKHGWNSNIQTKGGIDAIRNGIVLQRGHGKLIDASKLKKRCLYMSNDDTAIEGMEYVTKGMIENADAVIEADKDGE